MMNLERKYHSIKDGKKLCTHCKCLLPLDDFSRRTKFVRGSGYLPNCKKCSATISAQYRTKNPDKAKQSVSQYRKENPDKLKLSHSKTNIRRYGISEDTYNKILMEQNGGCAICGIQSGGFIKGKRIRLAIDHDHETGRVRGLLCNNCNWGIGNLKNDIKLLETAVIYLMAGKDHREF